MHVKAKQITFLGVLLALTIILVYGGTVIETNTLFFLCAASYCLGIAMKECGRKLGVAFFIGCTCLTFILVSNKMYCITLVAMNLYLVIKEFIEPKMQKAFRYVKYIIFNIIYIPALCLVPSLLYTGKISSLVLVGLWIGGQIGFCVYDYVYKWFMQSFWPKFRKRILL